MRVCCTTPLTAPRSILYHAGGHKAINSPGTAIRSTSLRAGSRRLVLRNEAPLSRGARPRCVISLFRREARPRNEAASRVDTAAPALYNPYGRNAHPWAGKL